MASPDTEHALERIAAEQTVSRLLLVACEELAGLAGASRVSISRVIGDLLVELGQFDGGGADPHLELYLVSDYPLTQEVLEHGEARVVGLGAADADPAEAALLERFGFDSLLMLPLRSRGKSWGLVELYANERRFAEADIGRTEAVVARVGELLAVVES